MTGLLNRYHRKLDEGFKPDADQERAILALDQLCRELLPEKRRFWSRKKPAPKGFYFYGGVGRGKSMVMDLFFGSAPVEKKRRIHFHAFMLGVHDFLHENRGGGMDGSLLACADKIAAESKLLCFDEFQVKDVADAMILGRLFTALFARGVTVVMTSNVAPDDLYLDGLQRDRFLPFIALLKEKLNIVHFSGDADYRLNRIRGSKLYFWPDDEDARAELEKIFLRLSDGESGAPLDIPVKGRILHVPRAWHEVAMFSFEELCGTEKSAVDYLTLIGQFRAFILYGVPKMTDMQRNAVLRFVTFIDAVYDHRARLVVSAAASPDHLYRGDDHAAVFQRTVSRLMEMQSETYAQ